MIHGCSCLSSFHAKGFICTIVLISLGSSVEAVIGERGRFLWICCGWSDAAPDGTLAPSSGLPLHDWPALCGRYELVQAADAARFGVETSSAAVRQQQERAAALQAALTQTPGRPVSLQREARPAPAALLCLLKKSSEFKCTRYADPT